MSTATRVEQVASAPPEIGVTLPTASRSRIDSIDLLRGIVIVLMALDHTKDYIGTSRFDPLDADVTNLPAYLTRWITHFCAPTFCFRLADRLLLVPRRVDHHVLPLPLVRRDQGKTQGCLVA
jgi:uncharacterized membrane protein